MNRLRIGIDLGEEAWQGPWRALVHEAVALAPDIDFHLFVPPADPLARTSLPNVQWVTVPPSGGWRHGWRLQRWQRRLGLELLHLPGLPGLPGWGSSGAPWAGALRAPLGPWAAWRCARARLLCVPSDWARQRLVERDGLDPARIIVTPPGVDGVRFHPGTDGQALVRALGLQPGGYVCCVARRDANKLPLSLLEAHACMPRPRPTLVLIGREDDPAHRRALDATVQRLGLDADVRCLDHISDTQLPALLRHARLCVQPSRLAHRGTAVLEAMASGVAVVVSDAPVLVERVGPAGLTVDPQDPHQLAAAVLCLLADPRRRAALAQRGLERAALHHTRHVAHALVEGWRHTARHVVADASPVWA